MGAFLLAAKMAAHPTGYGGLSNRDTGHSEARPFARVADMLFYFLLLGKESLFYWLCSRQLYASLIVSSPSVGCLKTKLKERNLTLTREEKCKWRFSNRDSRLSFSCVLMIVSVWEVIVFAFYFLLFSKLSFDLPPFLYILNGDRRFGLFFCYFLLVLSFEL